MYLCVLDNPDLWSKVNKDKNRCVGYPVPVPAQNKQFSLLWIFPQIETLHCLPQRWIVNMKPNQVGWSDNVAHYPKMFYTSAMTLSIGSKVHYGSRLVFCHPHQSPCPPPPFSLAFLLLPPPSSPPLPFRQQ